MRYVALLRGINVGGNTLIKMDALRECVAALGYDGVRTYIASGNVLFEGSRSSASHEPRIEARTAPGALEEDVAGAVRATSRVSRPRSRSGSSWR